MSPLNPIASRGAKKSPSARPSLAQTCAYGQRGADVMLAVPHPPSFVLLRDYLSRCLKRGL